MVVNQQLTCGKRGRGLAGFHPWLVINGTTGGLDYLHDTAIPEW